MSCIIDIIQIAKDWRLLLLSSIRDLSKLGDIIMKRVLIQAQPSTRRYYHPNITASTILVGQIENSIMQRLFRFIYAVVLTISLRHLPPVHSNDYATLQKAYRIVLRRDESARDKTTFESSAGETSAAVKHDKIVNNTPSRGPWRFKSGASARPDLVIKNVVLSLKDCINQLEYPPEFDLSTSTEDEITLVQNVKNRQFIDQLHRLDSLHEDLNAISIYGNEQLEKEHKKASMAIGHYLQTLKQHQRTLYDNPRNYIDELTPSPTAEDFEVPVLEKCHRFGSMEYWLNPERYLHNSTNISTAATSWTLGLPPLVGN
ncbi:hypothetical protein B0J17DRAFT_632003 [Rhizoctonia solani]|nr:hypothetical protein B0J17DRAFT_632003 [Rhizoctonia solani]